MSGEQERTRQTERWIAWVRLIAVPFAVLEVGVISTGYPPGYENWAWLATGVLGVGAIAFWLVTRLALRPATQKFLGFGALAFDAAIVAGYVVLYYSYEPDSPVRQILILPVAEAAVRYGVLGGVLLPFALAPFLAWGEELRADRFERGFSVDALTLPLGVEILTGLIIGWLSRRFRRVAEHAEARAAEAEELRDRLGRRADQLEAVNRVARALGSSLEQETAFELFLQEVRSVFEFDRLAIVLVEVDDVAVMANSGRGEATVFRHVSRQARSHSASRMWTSTSSYVKPPRWWSSGLTRSPSRPRCTSPCRLCAATASACASCCSTCSRARPSTRSRATKSRFGRRQRTARSS
jgi:hypothetical protein